MKSDSDRIDQRFTVPVQADQAFAIFTEEMNSWWPNEYTWSGSKLEKIGIEPG